MLPVADAALVPVSAAVNVAVPPFAIFVADEASARVDAVGPVTGVVFAELLPPQPMENAEMPAINSNIAQLVRLRRPGSQISRIDARLAAAPTAIIPAPGLVCTEAVEGAAVVTIRADCKGAPLIAPIDGENEQVTPTGKLPQLKDTSPV